MKVLEQMARKLAEAAGEPYRAHWLIIAKAGLRALQGHTQDSLDRDDDFFDVAFDAAQHPIATGAARTLPDGTAWQDHEHAIVTEHLPWAWDAGIEMIIGEQDPMTIIRPYLARAQTQRGPVTDDAGNG